PILQDPALAFHPPFLYMGYVGFSMAFSFAVAALIEGRTDAAWARWVRPWTLAAWMFLTIGIGTGSWWAYYELGWGGWWFWDPVENASFMPWLAGTALLHSAVVMEKREALKVWTILLAILTFSLSLMGAFIVRSGILTSVHSFALDPQRGMVILAIMAVFIGGALTLFAMRAGALRQGGAFAPVSREGSLVLNNILLTVATATVLLGTLYPLMLEAIANQRISVGPPFFNMTFVPLMVPLLIALPFGPVLAWKRGDLAAAGQTLIAALIIAAAAAATAFAVNTRGPWLAPLAFGLGMWVIVGAAVEIATRIRLGRAPLDEALRRAAGLPRSAWGTAFAHAGVGIMVLGIVGTSAWQQEVVASMKPGDRLSLSGTTIVFEGVSKQRGPNYQELIGRFVLIGRASATVRVEPSKRTFDAPRQTTTEAGIDARLGSDLYIVLGDEGKDGAFAVRAYKNPLVRLIWIGAIVMFLGGLLSMSDRRLRVGAPKPSRRRSVAAPAE
ncbi:MAG TPA: heme lyase CcmF/NrfE family subunit, partial [Hyphomicrobiaceae bacterium]|nr:heme lyase CcmF/NrfE family subunit [Hyphomicrobiaceae bacterium]